MSILSFISSLLNTKAAKIVILVIIIILGVILCIQHFRVKSLNKDIDKLNTTVLEKNAMIDDLNRQINLQKFEIETLNKGMNIVDDYHSKTEDVLNDASGFKKEIIEEAMSKEESKEWWNTPIPDNVLDMLTCHRTELLQATACTGSNGI